jgi:ankyrin repeat protein
MICLLQYAGPSALDARDNHGCTPFWYAAAAGHFKIIRLLDPSTNVHCKPNTGLTPLAIAALKGHPEVVRHLLDLNSYPPGHIRADPNATDYNGHTPLDNAIYGSHLDCMKLLREHGAVEGRAISFDSGSSSMEDNDLSSDEEA